MDSSPVLGQQSQNKMPIGHKRMKNELNTTPANSAASKQKPVPNLNKKDVENQDPEGSKKQKTPVRPGLSRLPVLAKSVHLHVPSDFTQSHKRWEENSPGRKSKRSKPCTKPVPFNFSAPRTTKTPIHHKPQTVATATPARATQLEKTGTANSKTMDMIVKPTSATSKTQGAKAHPSTAQHSTRKDNPRVLLPNNRDLSPEKEKPQGCQPSSAMSHSPKHITKIINNTLHASACPGHSSTFSRTPLALSNPPTAGTEACLNNFGLLSLKDPSKTPRTVHFASGVNSSSNTAGTGEMLHQPDHAAMLRFLQNEENKVMATTTPQSTKPYNYQPLRVSVLKSRKKAEPTTGPKDCVPFSPDPTALQSILQNEGVKGATPKASGRNTSIYSAQRVPISRKKTIERAMGPTNSVQFSPDPAALQSILQNEGVKAGGPTTGRGTSIYSAQRVPVSRSHRETIGGAMESSQRIPDTRHCPISSIHRKFLSASRVRYAGSPLIVGSQSGDKGLQRDVVCRNLLFNDEDEDSSARMKVTDGGGAETKAGQLSDQHSDIKSHPEQKGEISNYPREQESQSRPGGQPFLQAPERQSVIFFSTGKNLIRTPHVEKLENSALQEKHNTVVQKSGAPGCVVALLRRRKHLLEEERLDDEVATYTSLRAPDSASSLPPPAFQTPRPRCQNPLASVLHFQEFTRFVPINP